MKSKQLFFAGVLMLLVGSVLLAADASTPAQSMLSIDSTPPEIRSIYPDSTDPNTANLIHAGSEIQLSITVYDVHGAGADLTITSTGYSSTPSKSSWPTNPDGSQTYSWQWTIPNGNGVLYQFNWVIRDGWTPANILEHTTYAITGQPDGYFRVNGIDVTSADQVIKLNTLNINFEFVATRDPQDIAQVYVDIENAQTFEPLTTVTLTKDTDSHWTKSYTIPNDGDWRVYGYMQWVSGENFLKLSFFTTTNDNFTSPPLPSPFNISLLMIAGIVMLVLGGVATAVSFKKEL
ncbi:MAG: hypothetical protein ABIH76_08465 [Candidatus Bathyarchaeota archaeon]